MAGLLDFLNTDQGRMGLGLLAAAGPRTDGAGFGQRMQEGMGSFDAYKANQLKTQLAEMQMQDAQQKMAERKQEQAKLVLMQQAAQKRYQPASAGLPAYSGNPELGMMQAPAVAPTKAGFDKRGFAGDLIGLGDYESGMKMLDSIKGENQINKLDAKDFTPASVQKFQQTGDYSQLVRQEKRRLQPQTSLQYRPARN